MIVRWWRSGLVAVVGGAVVLLVLGCGGVPMPAAPEPPPSAAPPPPAPSPNVRISAVEEQPGYRRATLLDTTGFEQSVEAVSVLAPSGWNVDGRVSWNLETRCPDERVQVTMTMTSPDGASSVRILPAETWFWMEGVTMSGPTSCAFKPFPANPADHLEKVVAPALGAQVSSVAVHEPTLAELVASAAANAESLASSGANVRSSAMVGTLRYPDGHVGSVLVAVSVVERASPKGAVVPSGSQYTRVRGPILVEVPAAREDDAKEILDVVAGSVQTSSEWTKRVAQALSAQDEHNPWKSYDKSKDGYCETRGYDQQYDIDCDLPYDKQKHHPDEWQ